MANNFTERIEELQKERRQDLREAARARDRRREALARKDWDAARNAREVATNNNNEAQDKLRRIRVLRSARSKANALERLYRHRRSAGKASDGGQLYWYDGKKVRAEVYPHLVWARQHGWKGVVYSGYRDPVYSESLCYNMCGRSYCPGLCAGRSSNHVRIALDVSDHVRFGQLMERCPHKPRIYNRLSRDRVHFSPNGV